jgi:hypothetical protein
MNKLAVALSLPIGAALLLQANPSQAVTNVTIDETDYAIEFFYGTLTELLGQSYAPPSQSFPWYNNAASAEGFANALFGVEGSTTLQTLEDASDVSGQIVLGPLFYTGDSSFSAYYPINSTSSSYLCDTGSAINCEALNITWAYVDVPPTPTPAPLPLLGATAAFSYSRKLRRRLIAQKFTF